MTISSVAGKMGAPVSASYSASKHALQGFFDTLRMEVSDRNIQVTTICPGPVQSEGAENACTGVPGQRVGSHQVLLPPSLLVRKILEKIRAKVFTSHLGT